MEDPRIGSFIRISSKYTFKVGFAIPIEEGGEKDFKNIKLFHHDPEKQKIANDLTIKIKNDIIESNL